MKKEEQWKGKGQQKNPYPFSLGNINLSNLIDVNSKFIQEMQSAVSRIDQAFMHPVTRGSEILKELNAPVESQLKHIRSTLRDVKIPELSLPTLPPLSKVINPDLILSNSIEDLYKPFIQTFLEYNSPFREMLENISRIAKTYKDASTLLEDIQNYYVPFWQYTLIFFLRDFADISRMNSEVKEEHLVDVLLGIIQKQDFICGLKDLICKSPIHENRWKIIDEAFQLHTNKNYLMSIPPLLAQVEGMFRDNLESYGLVDIKERVVYEKSNNGEGEEIKGIGDLGKQARKRKSDLPDEKSMKPFADYALFVLAPERNDILHGRVTDYGIPGLSARLIFSIYGLAISDEETTETV